MNQQETARQLSRKKPAAGLFAFPDGCFEFATDTTQETPVLDAVSEGKIRRWFMMQEKANAEWQNSGMNGNVPDQIDAHLKALGYVE